MKLLTRAVATGAVCALALAGCSATQDASETTFADTQEQSQDLSETEESPEAAGETPSEPGQVEILFEAAEDYPVAGMVQLGDKGGVPYGTVTITEPSLNKQGFCGSDAFFVLSVLSEQSDCDAVRNWLGEQGARQENVDFRYEDSDITYAPFTTISTAEYGKLEQAVLRLDPEDPDDWRAEFWKFPTFMVIIRDSQG